MAAGIVKKLDSSNRSYYKVDDIVTVMGNRRIVDLALLIFKQQPEAY